MEEARRQKEIAEANKKKWHATRSKPLLLGTIRQREESPSVEAGGPSKLQGTGSPTRGTGVTKSPGLPQSILRNSTSKAVSTRKETDVQTTSSNRNGQASRVDEAGIGVGRGEEENTSRSLRQRGVDPTLQEMDQLELGQRLSSVKGYSGNLRRGKQSRLSMWTLWTQAR